MGEHDLSRFCCLIRTACGQAAIPEGLFVKQHCGNRLCCNPSHLYLSLNPIDGPELSTRAVEAWLRSRA